MANEPVKKEPFEFDDNALVQVYPGFVSKIHSGFVFAARDYFGTIQVYENSFPLVARLPFAEAKFINISRLSREVTYPDGIKINERVTVFCAAPIKYHFYVGDSVNDIRKVFDEINADKNVKDLVKNIVDLVVKNMDVEKVLNKFIICEDNLQELLHNKPRVIRQVEDFFNQIYDRYGIIIEDIFDIDFNDPEKVIEAETARRTKAIENETELECAQIELQISQIKAQMDFIKSVTDFESLSYAVQVLGLTTDEVCQFIRAKLLKDKDNITVIESLGGVDSLTSAGLNYFNKQFGDRGNSQPSAGAQQVQQVNPSVQRVQQLNSDDVDIVYPGDGSGYKGALSDYFDDSRSYKKN